MNLHSKKLAYYDPSFGGPYRSGAIGALGSYIGQVYSEQAEVPIGAASFERAVITTPRQPGGVSCRVCVLVDIQRIADREMGSRHTHKFTKAELLRCHAKWACALLLNLTLAPERGPIAEAEELAVEEITDPYDGKKHERRP